MASLKIVLTESAFRMERNYPEIVLVMIQPKNDFSLVTPVSSINRKEIIFVSFR